MVEWGAVPGLEQEPEVVQVKGAEGAMVREKILHCPNLLILVNQLN